MKHLDTNIQFPIVCADHWCITSYYLVQAHMIVSYTWFKILLRVCNTVQLNDMSNCLQLHSCPCMGLDISLRELST